MKEGKLLGHIVSKYGIQIDTKRVEAIQKPELPKIKKEVQSFLGRVNCLWRFIPKFVEILMVINNMLNNNSEVKWTLVAKQSFEEIKSEITKAPF